MGKKVKIAPVTVEYWTSREVMEYLRIGKDALANLRNNLKIPFSQVGGKMIYPVNGIKRFAERCAVTRERDCVKY